MIRAPAISFTSVSFFYCSSSFLFTFRQHLIEGLFLSLKFSLEAWPGALWYHSISFVTTSLGVCFVCVINPDLGVFQSYVTMIIGWHFSHISHSPNPGKLWELLFGVNHTIRCWLCHLLSFSLTEFWGFHEMLLDHCGYKKLSLTKDLPCLLSPFRSPVSSEDHGKNLFYLH